ncbi:non-ribosomal peptide synthetase [Aquimarina sp. I32.4]|uniref:non-ribosomal peptide synthetase n=1 Tax=Aquimarina sp. I32.4 TaxID=2053903 RepID=UPI000CDF22D9|nr:non-ribosomal peptide synthetase [Aquimarina sp. I32.4]
MEDFIKKISQLDLFLIEKNGDLILRGIKGKLGNEEVLKIQKNKEIINFIKDNKQKLLDHLVNKQDKPVLCQLSPLQEGMLFHGLYDNNSNAYIEQMICDFPKGINISAFKASWDYIIENHSILRTAFIYDQLSIPVMCVYKNISLPFDVLDYTGLTEEEQKIKFDALIKEDQQKVFAFDKAPLMRIQLVKIKSSFYRMIWTSHHILLDGWSIPILVGELLNAYENLSKGKSPAKKIEDKYGDYINYINSRNKTEEEFYWKEYLRNFNDSTLLPFVFDNDSNRNKGTGESKEMYLNFDVEVTEKIKKFSKKNHITVNTIVQGIWGILLSKYTGNQDVVYGATVSGRPSDLDGAEQRLGLYINTLPLRVQVDENQLIIDWLASLQQEQISAREYQYSSISSIQNWSRIKGDFFDSILVFENYPMEVAVLENSSLIIDNVDMKSTMNNYLLSIVVSLNEKLNIRFSYNETFLKMEYVEMISDHFNEVLNQLILEEKTTVSQIELVSKTIKEELLESANSSITVNSCNRTIVDMFNEQVKQRPNDIAIVFKEDHFTYQDIDEKSNMLANYLVKDGIQQESMVCISSYSPLEMIIGILGILKSGGAYVPIDPEFPSERINYVLNDTNAKCFITDNNAHSIFEKEGLKIIFADTKWPSIGNESVEFDEVKIHTNSLAYVIYTSGSTGNPKGVMVEHCNLIDYFSGLFSTVNLKQYTSFGLMSTLSTDLGNTILYGALLTGGTLHLFTKQTLTDADVLKDYFNNHTIDCIKIVPSHWNALRIDQHLLLPSKLIIFGGEELHIKTVQNIIKVNPDLKIINHYGPTETTIGKLLCYVDLMSIGKSIPIGKAFSNTQVYILNNYGHLVGIGSVGEICIAGAGVSRCYLNLQEDTNSKFVTNPFNKKSDSKLYKTGDLGRLLPNGNIEFLGRKDDQVKIRGHRLELQEIESVFNESSLVDKGIVLAKEDLSKTKELVGYILPERGYDEKKFRSYLETKLPDFMIPVFLIELKNFPLLSNGKIDKKSLPDPEIFHVAINTYVAPKNRLEEELVIIWKKLLKLEKIGIEDDFFQIGGNSLLAIRVVSAIRKNFQINLSIADLFKVSTICKISKYIENQNIKKQELLPPIVKETRPDQIPLSYSQERLWFIHKLNGSLQYHIPIIQRFKKSINEDILEDTFQEIINRHEVLRTVFKEVNGEAHQYILQKNSWSLNYIDKSTISDDNIETSLISNLISIPFDLSKDHMIKGTLIKISDDESILVLIFHHIACDGWSIPIFINEMIVLYQSIINNQKADLKKLPIQYADYAIWQKRQLTGEVLENKMQYWEKQLANLEVLHLPTDFTRPSVQSIRGGIQQFELNGELHDQLNNLSKKEGVTLFMTLLAAFQVLLHKYSGQGDICIGSPIANRGQIEIEPLIGFFVNTLALRSKIDYAHTFQEFLLQTKTTVLEAFEHQEVPFEKIVDKVEQTRDMSRNPLFQVLFVFRNKEDQYQFDSDKDQTLIEPFDDGVTQFDLTLNINETTRGLFASIEYCRDLYLPSSIIRIIENFKTLLSSIVSNPLEKITELSIITQLEEQKLLIDFNNTNVVYPKNKTLVDLFEEQVVKTPYSIAVCFENDSFTYKELDEKSNQLAHYLRKKGVEEESLVPICLERSLQMMVGLLGILKSGGAYVPIDPSYPKDRINFILEDVNVNIIVSNNMNYNLFNENNDLELLLINDDCSIQSIQPKSKVKTGLTTKNLAYVIYTSGSTGMPKGVMNQHSGIVNRLLWAQENYNLNSQEDIVLQKTTFCFDVSVWELFWPLITGAKVVFADPEKYKDSSYLKSIIEEYKITTLHFVPSMLELFLLDIEIGNVKSLKRVLCSGEELKFHQVQKFKEQLGEVELYNLYGPTEAAIDVTSYKVPEEVNKLSKIVIGKPIANTQLYVLDKFKKIVPIGVHGELHISGVQVARGYLNRETLTNRMFAENPFGSETNSRLYSTGDLVKWLPDGTIEYLGRLDNQVKIRGYRIELGEIEFVLAKSLNVRQSTVLVKEKKNGDKYLVGYIAPEEEFDKKAIYEYLKTKLPNYMVPELLVEISELPLTPNGKVDRQTLLKYNEHEISSNTYVHPKNNTENELVNIWLELLDIEKVGVQDNFFELGGHSLSIVRLKIKIQSQFNIVVPLIYLYQNPDIEKIAEYIDNLSKDFQSIELLQELTKSQKNNHKVSILTIPYLAGEGISFQAIANEVNGINSEIGVYTMSMPRETERYQNIGKLEFDLLVDELIIEINQKIHTPIIIWGHCGGSSFGSYLAKVLEKKGYDIIAFCSGGSLPSHLRTDSYKKPTPMSDAEIKELLSYAGLQEINNDFKDEDWDWIIKYYRFDINIQQLSFFNLVSKFENRNLKAQTYLVCAKDDPMTIGYAEAFQESFCTIDHVHLKEIEDGGHYFIETKSKVVAEFLDHIVCEYTEVSSDLILNNN